MADINVGEIPRFRGPFPENVARAIRGDGRQKLRRRTVLKGTIVAAGALGLSAIGWLPTARRAWGHHGASYDIKALPCPTYDFYDSNPPCGKPCGPSTIYPDACVDTQSFHYWGYHKDGSGSQNWDLRPGQCSGTFDGWIWRVEVASRQVVEIEGPPSSLLKRSERVAPWGPHLLRVRRPSSSSRG
jgi:hypothetical protein